MPTIYAIHFIATRVTQIQEPIRPRSKKTKMIDRVETNSGWLVMNVEDGNKIAAAIRGANFLIEREPTYTYVLEEEPEPEIMDPEKTLVIDPELEDLLPTLLVKSSDLNLN